MDYDLEDMIPYLNRGADVSSYAVLTPVLHDDEHRWYFTVATADGGHVNIDVVMGPKRKDALTARNALKIGLLSDRSAQNKIRTVIDCDEEVNAARWAERLWPSERATALRRAVEHDYGIGCKAEAAR